MTRLSGFYVRHHRDKEPIIGIVVLLALVLLVAVVLVGTGRIGGGFATTLAIFENAQGLGAGDAVMISGVPVGEVTRLELEDVGRVVATLRLEDGARPHVDARAPVRSLGFTGTSFVDYFPGNSEDFLEDGAVIVGLSQSRLTANIEELYGGMAQVLFSGQDFLSHDVTTDIDGALDGAERALAAVMRLDPSRLTAEAEAGLAAFQRAALRADSILAHSALDSLSRVSELRFQAAEMSAGLSVALGAFGRILARVDSSGILASDTLLYQALEDARAFARCPFRRCK
jgi:phospholipid/cholesterol/gamma-HCH transport system substrate-binding protein